MAATVLLVDVALILAGVLAMLTHTVWLGLPGLVLFGAGTLMTLIATWQAVPLADKVADTEIRAARRRRETRRR